MQHSMPSLYLEFSLYLIEENWVQSESNACWFLFVQTLLITNNKNREVALKNEAGGDEKHLFFVFVFTWPYIVKEQTSVGRRQTKLDLCSDTFDWQLRLSTWKFFVAAVDGFPCFILTSVTDVKYSFCNRSVLIFQSQG